ncbi:MAG: geranylgeranyl reductase family protein [Chitinivibrionales bacterium]|nr:geranylgeranyl reductase family protein [Chitinivibrionales bacterium]MBD3396206.1 geranylgeranyl reductase family protein [Chitinivibrionales bacterium]
MNGAFDIVIIGAGPAGLAAARQLVSPSGSPRVLLVDKSTPWKHPIPCAEGVFCPQFHQAIDPKESWIRFTIDRAVFHSPNHSSLVYQDINKGYIIDRARMQKDLADECGHNGAECAFERQVTQVEKFGDDGTRRVTFGDGECVSARVVIDCSGPLSSLGRGEPIHCKPMDLEVAYLAHIRTSSVDTDTVHIHAGKDIAPGGYAWTFPRTRRSANVGIIVGSPFRAKANVRRLLECFLKEHFPDSSVEQAFAGTIPCSYGRKTLATYGLIKAGDAASTVNPISRAGISEAMLSGSMAGTCALAMLGAGTKKKMAAVCKEYEKAWYEKRGKRHARLAKVKNSLAKVPDSDYNRAAESLSTVPRKQLTMSRIFSVSLARFPRLVWALRHMM